MKRLSTDVLFPGDHNQNRLNEIAPDDIRELLINGVKGFLPFFTFDIRQHINFCLFPGADTRQRTIVFLPLAADKP